MKAIQLKVPIQSFYTLSAVWRGRRSRLLTNRAIIRAKTTTSTTAEARTDPVQDDIDLQRVAIVTGAASGIGLACAQKFLSKGYIVHSWDVKPSPIEHDNHKSTIVDVADFDVVQEAADAIKIEHGHIDVLVNNAAIQPEEARCPLHEVPPYWWRRTLEINVGGVYNTARVVIPNMIAQHLARKELNLRNTGGGVIINMSSVQGLMSQPNVPAYAASKGAMLSLTRSMACDYGKYGIRVNAINPGTIDTPLVRKNVMDAGATMEQAGQVYPLEHRVGLPEEVANVAFFLASQESSFMSGTAVNVDGAILAQGGWATTT